MATPTYASTRVTGAATVVIPAAVVHTVVVNSKGTLAVLSDSSQVRAIIDTSVAPGTFLYDMAVSSAFTVTSTGAGTDITVTWI